MTYGHRYPNSWRWEINRGDVGVRGTRGEVSPCFPSIPPHSFSQGPQRSAAIWVSRSRIHGVAVFPQRIRATVGDTASFPVGLIFDSIGEHLLKTKLESDNY